jgi:hypothetical protein
MLWILWDHWGALQQMIATIGGPDKVQKELNLFLEEIKLMN